MEEALKQISKLSDEEFSRITAEIISESSVKEDKTQPALRSLIVESNYHRKPDARQYTCLEDRVAANDTNLSEAA